MANLLKINMSDEDNMGSKKDHYDQDKAEITDEIINVINSVKQNTPDDMVQTKINTTKELVTVWKHLSYISTFFIMAITIFQGIGPLEFKLSDSVFITTVVSLIISSTILVTITKLLNRN